MRGGIATDFAPRALRRANALAGQTLDNPENRRPAKCQVVTVLDQDISYGRVRCAAGRPFGFWMAQRFSAASDACAASGFSRWGHHLRGTAVTYVLVRRANG